MLLTEREIANWLGSAYFTDCTERQQIRRVRALLKEKSIQPVYQNSQEVLYSQGDLQLVMTPCRSNYINEKDRPTGPSPGRIGESASERVRKKLGGTRQTNIGRNASVT